MKYETWSTGNGYINFYTTNPMVGRIIKQMFRKITTYERNGNIFAWQCTMPATKLNFVEMQIKKKLEVENQQLTRVGKAKFRFKDRNPMRVVHSYQLHKSESISNEEKQ